jgi:hypothetical protein
MNDAVESPSVNWKVALVEADPNGGYMTGPDVTFGVGGGVVSTVNDADAAYVVPVSAFPKESVAWTCTM